MLTFQTGLYLSQKVDSSFSDNGNTVLFIVMDECALKLINI